ncbi:MAG: class I SAM-dependent methyltransferase [Polyangiaceae bacterium]
MKTPSDLDELTTRTLAHYNASAKSFWEGTRDHDVSQNIQALLAAMKQPPPFKLLDFGCGPGRDLATFRALGHEATGLDGCSAFVEMARAHSGCDVWHQNFLNLTLPPAHFDGVFANASLFHVPQQELASVLRSLHGTLAAGGVLFSSNPRGDDTEGFSGGRYGAFHSFEEWSHHMKAAGFTEISHYDRPEGKPRHEQPWLASLWRK